MKIKDSGSIIYDEVSTIPFNNVIHNRTSFLFPKTFSFLNLEHTFEEKIDWNYNQYGKLWTYNLCYFDFLNQKEISIESGIELLYSFINDISNIKDGKEPYPTSLRIINTIKFLLANDIHNIRIQQLIAEDAYRLTRNLEYHLLANHLLENAFALYFAGMYLNNPEIKNQGITLLKEQLQEQILPDGSHYELSPMYHQLMLFRVLDCIQITKDETLKQKLISYASSMLNWLETITFNNGDIPLVNDAAFNINPNTEEIIKYANVLSIYTSSRYNIKESGYRKLDFHNMEILVDIGNIRPTYQPGHAHADTFSFVLYKDHKPFIVDTGTSTYSIGERRSIERSTKAHNTVTVNNKNSSDVWSGFRVGKRAKSIVLKESAQSISAVHNGYFKKHTRTWQWNDNHIEITDHLESNGQGHAHIHFHPNVKVEKKGKEKIITNYGEIRFCNSDSIDIQEYFFAPEFNTLVPSRKVVVTFTSLLRTEIYK